MAAEKRVLWMLTLLVVMPAGALPPTNPPANPPAAGFWQYYLEYGTDAGDVFDPADLADATELAALEQDDNDTSDNDEQARGEK